MYLQDTLTVYKPSCNLRSSTSQVNYSFHELNTPGGTCILTCRSKLWNSLPMSLRHTSSLNEFKSNLKTYLFNLPQAIDFFFFFVLFYFSLHCLVVIICLLYIYCTVCISKPQDSFGEFNNFFLDLQKVQEIIRKHHQTFLQLFGMTYCNMQWQIIIVYITYGKVMGGGGGGDSKHVYVLVIS